MIRSFWCSKHFLSNASFETYRWFDKSFNVVIYGNGRFGVNAEHSWADAPIMSYLVEHVLGAEFLNEPFDQDGNCKGTPRSHLHPFPPTRLNFELNEEVNKLVFLFFLNNFLINFNIMVHIF